ncbi:glycosyltransferase family 1 protein [Herbidospora galbida]|uniref:Glycosyltransferase family 1 protein n=1 Tax=Herbidospora galbida TaxID=2575442 RepID=A0A4U3MPY3_9ACTN|nr:glycosyltransferase [Herbidospora galbida]TKK90822.1 glycosyltransferase family 1 protein [Herbidospora galbida]
MRIAMVSEHASPLAALGSPDAGGQNVHVAALATAVAALGHEVTVYTRRDDPRTPQRVPFAPGVTVAHVPAGPPAPIPKDDILPWVPRFAEWLREQWTFDRPDVAHSHFWMSGLATLDAARRLGIPFAHTYHALGTVKRRHQGAVDTSPAGRIAAETAIGHRADVIVSTCPDEVDELVRMGIARHRTQVVPCGVDLDRFHPGVPPAERPDRPRLLSIGRLVPRKGVDTIIAALPYLPGVELVVGGGLPLADLHRDEEATRLRATADRLGVADRVIFTGQVARDDVPGLMRSATAVVCVPWYEPFGMVVLEAMACGVPVIASAVGGQQDTVVDGVTGLLVAPRRPESLAEAVGRLLDDPARSAAYGIAGADRASARYSWDRVARETVAAYRQAMRRRERTAS